MLDQFNRIVFPKFLKAALTLVCVLLAAGVIFSQESRTPARGFQAGSSYSISDIESVNLTNGNLMLNIPLATLPAGRGSDSEFRVTLRYDSKLWDTQRENRTDGSGAPDEGGYNYSRDLLKKGEHAGWKLDTGGYALIVRNRMEQEPEMQCTGPNAAGEAAIVQNGFIWRVEMRLPDGSIKEFRPYGMGYPYSDLYNNGYFEISPNGAREHYYYEFNDGHPTCGSTPEQVTTAGMNYYSADGSGMRLYVPYNANDQWKLYYPNGTSIESLPANTGLLQRQTDRNGNTITWKNATVGNYSGVKIENDAGQFIMVNDGQVVQPGTGGELLVTSIARDEIWVNRKYRTTHAVNANQNYIYDNIRDHFDVVTSITLPENLGQYHFTYNGAETTPSEEDYTSGFGEVKSVGLPSTAKAEYEYRLDDRELVPSSCTSWAGCANAEDGQVLYNSVTKRDLTYDLEYDGSSTETTETTLYDIVALLGNSTVTGPNGSVMSQSGGGLGAGPSYTRSITLADGSITEKVWAQNKAPKVTGNQSTFHITAVNAYVKTEFTSIKNANGDYVLTAIKDYDYDKNGNVLEVREYDWVNYGDVVRNPYPSAVPASAILKRKTVNTYYYPTPVATDWATDSANHYANPSSPALKNLIKSSEIRDGNNTVRSRNEFYYDGGSGAPDKGNLTETRAWDSTKGGVSNPLTTGLGGNSISTLTAYDAHGNPTLVTDAKGVQTAITYGCIDGQASCADNLRNLYPTKVETAANYPELKRTSTSVYDVHTGLVTSATDEDNDFTNVVEYDHFGRAVKAITAQGTALESWTRTEYDDVNRRVIVRSDLETKGDGKKVTVQFFDQLRRVRLSKTLEDASTQSAANETDGVKVQTRYKTTYSAPNGYTYQLASNPYRANYSYNATVEETMGWALSKNWHTGKKLTVETFSGAALPVPFAVSSANTASTGVVTTDIDANRTLITDQAGKQRIRETNALGQLTDIWEITAQDTATTAITFPGHSFGYGYHTNYQYDTLSNLKGVNQGDQTRTFTYSSLARLLTAENPESGTISYQYDANGNLTQKSQPRSGSVTVTTSYVYDELNRVLQRSYSGESGYTTPAVEYTYDSLLHAKGKLTKVSSSVSTTEYTGFDLLGRVTSHKQSTGGNDYTTGYAYNLSGALVEETYPTGRKVRNVLDGNGDLSIVQSRKNSAQGYWTYANSFTYNATGALSTVQLGNGHWESTQFNSRLQPIQIALGITQGASSLLKIEYGYGGTANNGNVLSQNITVPVIGNEQGFTANQTYAYDSLNRLHNAQEMIGTAQTWKQTFSYDRFGGRNFDEANTTTLPENCTEGGDSVVCAIDRKIYNPSIDLATNRLNSNDNYSFDSAGNILADAQNRTYIYDGENKQVEVIENNISIGKYYYDGDGRRVKKETATETTIFIYDAGGKLVVESSTQRSKDPQVAYLTSDTLGTPRINTSAGGAVIARHDYHPFGEEITVGRSAEPGYDTDDIRKKFTGYERDEETDLDFAQARYYSNQHGRYTSTDPILMSEDRTFDPQRINLYGYARNNPYKYVDPNGEDIDDSSLKDNEDYQKWKEAFLATKSGRKLWDKYHNDKNFKLTIVIGENDGGKNGAETIIKKDNFNSEGKLVSASIILGKEFAKKEAAGSYPILGWMTSSDASIPGGGNPIDRLDRAVAFLAHEFGHVEDANKAGADKWLADSSILTQNKALFEKYGTGFANSDEYKELLNQCGGCTNISDLKSNREIRADGYSISVIQEHFGKSGVPGRVKDAIKEYGKKYGNP